MLVTPDTTIRVANSEAVSLGLDVDVPLAAVRLLPHFGNEATLDLTQGEFTFPAFTPPDAVKVEWLAPSSTEAAFTTYVEVVSRHYFTLDQLKAYGNGQDDFDECPEEELWAARQAATEVFEENAHRAFVKRIGRTKDYGRDDLLNTHFDLETVLTDGYAPVCGSKLERTTSATGAFPRWVEYIYGADSIPAEVSRAALELAAYTLRPSNRPIGATGESSDAGYIHFTVAGRDGATAIPEVNAAIQQFGVGERLAW